MLAQEISGFFKDKWYSGLFGNPEGSGHISIRNLAILVSLVVIIGAFFYSKVKKKKNTLESLLFALSSPASPVEGTIKISGKLLSSIVADQYEGLARRKLFSKNILNFLGAVFVSALLYFVSILLVVAIDGISVATLEKLTNGDIPTIFALFKSFASTYPWLNMSVLGVVFYAIYSTAKVTFLEDQYWPKKKAGLVSVIPVSEWDETPKFTFPEDGKQQEVNELILKAMSKGYVDQIRIKVSSGFEAFGVNGYLLSELKKPNRTWKILIMDPIDVGAGRRAEQYNKERAFDPPEVNPQEYLNGIEATIERILKIKKESNPDIHIRKYRHTPQWKIIQFASLIFIQGFGPGQRSDRAPLFVFEANSTSLYHSFVEMFEDIWRHESAECISKEVQS